MFVDRVVLDLIAGKGGNGVIAWRREKYIPKGGPSGGNGGKGGSITLQADAQIFCLDWYRHRKRLKGENGQQGGSNQRQGRQGEPLLLKVPCGTLVKDAKTGQVLYDLTEDKEEFVVCKGGRGGLGNVYFKSPTNRTPAVCTPGKPGEEREVELELKLIADIGLVGFPNAGKSTLFKTLADVDVKIAPYPFTTLHPNLGFILFPNRERRCIADIPGIIEDAHQDRGLGLEFLRHIERTKLLLFVVDASGIDDRHPIDDFRVLQHEIRTYNPRMLERPSLVILNKCDTEESQEKVEAFLKEDLCPQEKLCQVSATEGTGIQDILAKIQALSFP